MLMFWLRTTVHPYTDKMILKPGVLTGAGTAGGSPEAVQLPERGLRMRDEGSATFA